VRWRQTKALYLNHSTLLLGPTKLIHDRSNRMLDNRGFTEILGGAHTMIAPSQVTVSRKHGRWQRPLAARTPGMRHSRRMQLGSGAQGLKLRLRGSQDSARKRSRADHARWVRHTLQGGAHTGDYVIR